MSDLRRVGVNLLYLVPGQVGGTEIYARELTRALAEERPDVSFIAFCGRDSAGSLADEGWPANVEIVELPIRQTSKPLRVGGEFSLLAAAASRADLDVLHSFGTTSPPVVRAARVVTIHDLIYDHVPGSFPAAARIGLKFLVPLGARRAHRVITPSEATARDVVQRLRLPRARIDVVPNGFGVPVLAEPAPERVVRERLGLDDGPVILSVAAALPHKNLDRLISAFGSLADDGRQAATLVLVGHAGRISDDLRAAAHAAGVGERVRLTGWIETGELESLYRMASIFVYPSLMEGFGMPVLEAMARGVPVACSDAGSLPEVAGDAALLFDPHDSNSIRGALRKLLEDAAARRQLIERGHTRARGFPWRRTAQGTLASYARAVAARTAARSAG